MKDLKFKLIFVHYIDSLEIAKKSDHSAQYGR
jgi:hypothetical protein